jgi:hypothetical protein
MIKASTAARVKTPGHATPACGWFPETPEERRLAVDRFLAERPQFVPYAGNLLQRPDIAPLAVDMLHLSGHMPSLVRPSAGFPDRVAWQRPQGPARP